MSKNFDLEMLLQMAHSPLENYVIPGLTSKLIGAPSPYGTVRLFECSRDHQESITPHSHRFDLQCWVLKGKVRNRIWTEVGYANESGDMYCATTMRYDGSVGKYQREDGISGRWVYGDYLYAAGDWYAMKADEVHSIYFSKGAKVLFFEGPMLEETSIILEPVVNGEVIPTMKVEPWMFKRKS
jgi:hypothetical protein